MPLEAVARSLSTEPSPGALIAGKYRVERVIGRGGMGRVLSATNESTGKRVALKWLLDESSPNATARFSREARAAGRIHHPNVVDVYDVVEHEGTTCIVMELLHGESLSSALAREGTFAIDRALDVAIEIGRGLAAAHAAGVIHRDLKPGNVFLGDSDGSLRVKILDFGISKVIDLDQAALTDTGVVLGTPQYLAPEQVRGATITDPRVDVYAVGAVLYEMLSGRPPHQHAHVPALLVEIATVAPRPIRLLRPDVGPSLSDLVTRTLAKEPEARPPSADALVVELRRERGLPGETPRGGSKPALEADTIDPARPLVAARRAGDSTTVEALGSTPRPKSPIAQSEPPSAEVVTPSPGARRSAVASDARAGWLVALFVAIAAIAAIAWQNRSPETPTTQAPAPTLRTEPAPVLVPAAGTGVRETVVPSTSASLPLAPPTPPARIARRPPSRTAALTETSPAGVTSAPPPETTTSAIPPTSAPRAGRLGLDDL